MAGVARGWRVGLHWRAGLARGGPGRTSHADHSDYDPAPRWRRSHALCRSDRPTGPAFGNERELGDTCHPTALRRAVDLPTVSARLVARCGVVPGRAGCAHL